MPDSRSVWRFWATVLAAAIGSGCGDSAAGTTGATVEIEPGTNAAERAQEALIVAEPGAVVLLRAGRYTFRTPLSCEVENVTLRGDGPDRTILFFGEQAQGGEGVLGSARGFCIEDLAIEDTAGDGLKVTGSDRVAIRRVRVEWTRGPHTQNGGYGIYPIQCTNVLVEDSVAVGASDAGIYVGQSEDVVVRRNEVRHCVAGIEIENCRRVDVYGNNTHDNTGGILVFDLPTTPKRDGGHVRVFDNDCHSNNHPNFAPPGNIVSIVPSGTGVLVMANDSVEIFDNRIGDHRTVNLTIASYRLTAGASEAAAQATWDEAFEPDPEAVFVHHNTFGDCGSDPQGSLGLQMAAMLGQPLPDIVYDGQVDPRKVVDGVLPPELGVYFADNGDVRFANLRLSQGGPPDRSLAAHAGSLPPLAAVTLPVGLQ